MAHLDYSTAFTDTRATSSDGAFKRRYTKRSIQSPVEDNGGWRWLAPNHTSAISIQQKFYIADIIMREAVRRGVAFDLGASIPGLRSDFSTDGSEEDFELTTCLVDVPRVYGAGHERVLPRRQGSIDLSWVKAIQLGAASVSTADLESVINGLNTALSAERFDIVDNVFRQSDIKAMAVEVIIACLRVPFMARHRLHEWAKFRERARDELVSRNIDADRLLRGLA